MKRYWLFGYDTYYPGGGLSDVVLKFNVIEEVQKFADEDEFYFRESDWYQILDMETHDQFESQINDTLLGFINRIGILT
jgi:hypothetical protein